VGARVDERDVGQIGTEIDERIGEHVGGLLSCGIAVWDHFLCADEVSELLDCAQMRRARGEFRSARVGVGDNRATRRHIRGDITCWLDEPLFDVERLLLSKFERLRREINGAAFLGLFDIEAHYACYAPGTGYARHVDQLQGRTQRLISLVLYLNARWQAEDGGELRVFAADGGHRDIEPVAGRLVCFLTEACEHAVLPTRRDRSSICAWFRCRESPA